MQQVVVMAESNQSSMATGRALTTDTEREYLRGEEGEQRMYEAKSRVKRRIQERLAEDVDLFAEEHPELLDELRGVVCGDSPTDLSFTPIGRKNVSYGPSSRGDAAFVLRVGTEDGTLELHLNEDEMYELWTEVQHTPWPDTLDEQDEAGRLRQQLVDLAMGADAEMLRDALNTLDPHWQER